jgi:predicted DNA-binding protein (MmcQ/YjbR family)
MIREHDRALKRLRQICSALPETSEVIAWGHPNFKVANKTFAAFEKYRGEWAIAFKAEREHQQFLVNTDARFYVSPYVGKHGWVSMKIGAGVDWPRVKMLIAEAYRLTATAHAEGYRSLSGKRRPARRPAPAVSGRARKRSSATGPR